MVKENNSLLFYAFDWDDNLLNMSSEIIVLDDKGEEVGIETHDFANFRSKVGKEDFEYKGHNIVSYPMVNGSVDYDRAYRNFMDSPDPTVFFKDVKEALQRKNYAPSWEDFIECVVNGCLFSIITARGHEPQTIREAVEYIINTELSDDQKTMMYNNLLKFIYIFEKYNSDHFDKMPTADVFTENPLVTEYLFNCEYIGVSAESRGGSPEHPEEAKREVLIDFKKRINNFAKSVGMNAKIGFSDDDKKNIEEIEDLLHNLDHEDFSHITHFVIKNTNDPNNISKKIRTIE